MYFDAVRDENGNILFNGTPEDTRQFLLTKSPIVDDSSWDVVPGRTMEILSVAEFLAGKMGR